MLKVHTLILHTGYTEDYSTSSLILWHFEGFETVEDAFNSLGSVFLEAWEGVQKRRLDHAKRYQRCPHCNEPLVENHPAQAEDVAEMVREYHGSTVDSSYYVWELLNNVGWQTGLFDAPKESLQNSVFVYEHAEAILGIVATGDQGEYQDFVCDWERHMVLPTGMTLRKVQETKT